MGKVEFGTWTPFKVRPLAEEYELETKQLFSF